MIICVNNFLVCVDYKIDFGQKVFCSKETLISIKVAIYAFLMGRNHLPTYLYRLKFDRSSSVVSVISLSSTRTLFAEFSDTSWPGAFQLAHRIVD